MLGRPWPVPAQQPPTQQTPTQPPPAQQAPTQPAPTQQAPAQQAPAEDAMPAGYVGAETCKGCHEEAYHKFEATRMGRLFLKRPRNTTERLACENCHGPGQKHVEAGGGKGVGGLNLFAQNVKKNVVQPNEIFV